MPRRPRNLSTYPHVFFQVLDIVAHGLQVPPLSQPDGHTARSNQRLWHKFRVALISNRHPGAEASLDLICRVTNVAPEGLKGQYYLEFASRGLAILADELRPSRGGGGLANPHQMGLPSPLRDDGLHVPGLDDALGQVPKEVPAPEAIRQLLNTQGEGVEGYDPTEEPFRKMLEGPGGPAPLAAAEPEESEESKELRALAAEARKRVDPATCTHEWDATDTHCVHCNSPKEESGQSPTGA